MILNFCDRVEPFVEDEEILWKAEKQILRNGRRITAYEIGDTPTKAKVKLYSLLKIALIFFSVNLYSQSPCWEIYKNEIKIDTLKNDKGHGIKPGATLYIDKTLPGIYKIAFFDPDKGQSKMIIQNCNKSTILNIYKGQGRVKVFGNCQINHIEL